MNDRIVDAAVKAANGLYPDIAREPGWCLSWVRRVVEYGCFDGRAQEFYRRYLVAGTSRRGGSEAERLAAAWRNPWAADAEASMKKLGLAVPALLRQAGDLVFNHNAAIPFGHVGILLDRDWILELVDPAFRPRSVHLPRNVQLTRYRDWPEVTLVARLR